MAVFGRDTGNRTQSPRTRIVCTTGILYPEQILHYKIYLQMYVFINHKAIQ